MAALRDALRERLTFRAVLLWFSVMALLRFGFGASTAQLVTTVAVSVIFGLTEVVQDAYDLRDSLGQSGVGLSALLGGAALLAFDEGPLWLPAALLAVGGWFVLDAVQTVRHEGIRAPETTRDGRDVYREYVARRVHETVKERPRTRRELGDELDADEAAVDAAVDRLVDRDVLERAGSELRVASTPNPGTLGRAREHAAALARRIGRPVTREFRSGADDGDGHVTSDSPGVGSEGAGADQRPGSTGAATDGVSTSDGSDRERELERERESASDR